MTEKAHPGAPHEKRWPPWAKAALEAVSTSPNVSFAARQAGVARQTINRLVQRDEAFALAFHDAREQALDTLEDTILLRARSGQPVKRTVTKRDGNGTVEEVTEFEENHISDTLAMFFLKRWRPEYRESYRIEQSGPGGGPIRMDIETRITDAVGLFDAEVVRLSTDRNQDGDPGANGGGGGPLGR